MSKFAIWVVGLLLLVTGVAFALDLVGVPDRWIVAAVLIALGIGVTAGATRTKRDDPPQV